jgi:hypothetical protein
MAWRRLGRVYPGHRAASHAALPSPLHLRDDIFRFYFSARDGERRSHVYWADIEIGETPRCLGEAERPVLSPGEDGTFDDSGVSLGCVLRTGRDIRLYYMGWNLGVRSPWRNAIGLAMADDVDGPFTRFSPGPIMDRSPQDPYTLSYPCVLHEGNAWRMWYGSNLSAAVGNADMSHTVKFAASSDGVRWDRDGKPVINFDSARENAIARPSLILTESFYLMAYACRGEQYRIEVSASRDGLYWTRREGCGLGALGNGWDSQMTCYPSLFTHHGRLWMAYNGNGYGATGFGLAIWDGALQEILKI